MDRLTNLSQNTTQNAKSAHKRWSSTRGSDLLFFDWKTVNEKRNWAELNSAKNSGIVSQYFSLSLVTVPEVFAAQFHLRFQSGESSSGAHVISYPDLPLFSVKQSEIWVRD